MVENIEKSNATFSVIFKQCALFFFVFQNFQFCFLADYLYNHLKNKNAGAAVNLQAGNGYGVNANLGYNNQYVSQDFYKPTGPIETIWYESEPAEFDRTEPVVWKSSGDSDKRKRK